MSHPDPADHPSDRPRETLDRRTALKHMLTWTVATAGVALAQQGAQPMQHGAPGATAGA